MASIANELDSIGLEKEANQVTMSMLKVAQAPKDYLARQQSGQLTTDPYLMQRYIDKAIAKKQTVNQLYDELAMTSSRAANDMAAYLKAIGVTATNKPIPPGTNILIQAKKQNLPLGPNTKIMDYDPLKKNFQNEFLFSSSPC